MLNSKECRESALQEIKPPPLNARAGIFGLLVILVMALSVRLLLFTGCLGTDDLSIWQLATELSRGNWKPEQILQNALATMRYAPSLATASFLFAFGNNEYTANLYPLLMSLMNVVIAWDITRRMTSSALGSCAAALIAALASLDVQYATITMPDGPLGAVSLLSIWHAVVGIERDRRSPGSFNVAFLVCGFLAAVAVSHKIVAAQLCGALSMWGLVLVLQRQFRLNILLIPLGFFIGFGLEHLTFKCVYGDWFHRWEVISRAQKSHRSFREAHDVDALSYFDRLSEFTDSTLHSFPSFAAVVILGLILACVFFVQHRRNRVMNLCALYLICLVAMRLYELTGTFSYQPRRLVPLSGITAVMIGFLVGVLRKPRWIGPAMAISVFAVQASLFVRDDADEIRHESHTLDAERWIRDWTRTHAQDVRDHGLYIDHRTFKTLHALRGFEDLTKVGIMELAGPEGREMPIFGPQPVQYQPGGYFYENSRVLNWLAARENGDPRFSIIAEIPDTWLLVGIAEHGMSASFNSALYRIADVSQRETGSVLVEEHMRFDESKDAMRTRDVAVRGVVAERFGWLVSPVKAAAKLVVQRSRENAVQLSLSHDGQVPVRIFNTLLDNMSSSGPLVRSGEFIVLRWPVHCKTIKQGGVRPTVTYEVFGQYANCSEPTLLYQRKSRLYFDEQDLRAYIVAHENIYDIRVAMTFHTQAKYTIDEPRLTRYESLEFNEK